jgi:hypothetical protein
MSDGFEQVSFLDDPMPKAVRVTVEFADEDRQPVVFDLDHIEISQDRPVSKRMEGDRVAELLPSKTTTVTLMGSVTAE